MKWLHKAILLILLGKFGFELQAQNRSRTIDVGGFVGMNTVYGDITTPNHLNSFRPSLGGLVRIVPNDRIAYRFMLETGNLYGQGNLEIPTVFEDNLYGFSRPFTEFSALYEVNWKEYRVKHSMMSFSPFLGVGLGAGYYYSNGHGFDETSGSVNGNENDSGMVPNPSSVDGEFIDQEKGVFSFSIPVVFGVKFNLGGWWSMSTEVYAKKLFSDKIDNLDDPYQYFGEQGHLKSSSGSHNNDWMFGGRICIYWQIYHGCRVCPDFK